MKIATRIALLLLALLTVLTFAACADVEQTGAWENATHTSDKTFGKGGKTVQVEVKAEEQSITFTIKTDAETLGDALKEHDLIAGEEGAYGLYIKTVNGIMADYNVDQTYWSLTKNSEMLMTGADSTPIADGEHYELTKTK